MSANTATCRAIRLIALAATFASSATCAADLSTRYAAPAYTPQQAVFSWTGLYAGLNVGGGTSGNDALGNLPGADGGKVRGALGGLQIGYNYQLSPMLVVGIENDLEATDLKNKDAPNGLEASVPWLTTGRARAGVALMDSRLLLFGTAGLAAGGLKDGPLSKVKTGWTAGGGVEWAFLPKWSAKMEYLYIDFKHDDLPDWNAAKFHTVRLGVNYHFDLLR